MKSQLTVTTAADTIDLTTVETVRQELGDDALSADLLRRWISEESAKIAAHCRRTFGAETVQEIFYLDETSDEIVCSRLPIVSVTSVVEDDDAALDDALYQIDAEAGILRRLDDDGNLSRWSTSRVTVIYEAGYTLLGTLPRPIEAACIQMVTRRVYNRGRDPQLRREEVHGATTLEWWVSPDYDGMTMGVRDMLSPYVDGGFS